MFESFIKRPVTLEKYRNGPYAEERRQYLAHVCAEGRSSSRLEVINSQLLAIASQVDLSGGRSITADEPAAVAERWSQQNRKPETLPKYVQIAKTQFLFIASSWLRFAGRLEEGSESEPFADHLDSFLVHLSQERGFSAATIENRQRSLRPFLTWLAERGSTLSTLSPADVAGYFSRRAKRALARTTISFHVQSLRSFFRYAHSRCWCGDIAGTIDAPRLYTHENLPQGPSWADIRRLLAGVGGDTPADIRNRAVLLLLAVYGFRVGEVRSLRLEDLDWKTEADRLFGKSKEHQVFLKIASDPDCCKH